MTDKFPPIKFGAAMRQFLAQSEAAQRVALEQENKMREAGYTQDPLTGEWCSPAYSERSNVR